MPVEHQLECRDEIPLPIEQVFAFFSDAGNLEVLTPPALQFEIVTPQPIAMRSGTVIDYRLRLLGIPFLWQSEITEWNPPHAFVDEARRGPYASWHQRHTFASSAGGGTIVADRVRYTLPFSPLGDLAYPFVRWQLRAIFAFRRQAMRETLLTK
jgi:ligand-binding SRPBCC domain-containing protein